MTLRERIEQFTISCQETLEDLDMCYEEGRYILYCYPLMAKYNALYQITRCLWRLLASSDDVSYLASNLNDLSFYAYLGTRWYEQGAKLGDMELSEERAIITAGVWLFYREELKKVLIGTWVLPGENDHE